jgi:hypothetical protein
MGNSWEFARKVSGMSSIMLLFSYCLEPIRMMLRLHNCILANKVVRFIRVTWACASVSLPAIFSISSETVCSGF